MNEPQALTQEQIDFAVRCMARYINVREDHGHGLPNSADVDHSSLLRRLLSGKQPLEQPPPKRYSYPDYDLAEGKEGEIRELWERDDDHPLMREDGGHVVIDQHPYWEWEDREKKILRYVPTGDLYQYMEKTAYPVWVRGDDPKNHPYQDKFLQKLEKSHERTDRTMERKTPKIS